MNRNASLIRRARALETKPAILFGATSEGGKPRLRIPQLHNSSADNRQRISRVDIFVNAALVNLECSQRRAAPQDRLTRKSQSLIGWYGFDTNKWAVPPY